MDSSFFPISYLLFFIYYLFMLGWLRKYFLLVLAFLSFSMAAFLWVFSSRQPVLIVTDASFSQLYGRERLQQKTGEISRALFRPLVPVIVSENAGPDHVAIAVEEAFSSPWAVLFPHRYHEGARLYKKNNPDIRVLLLGNGQKPGDFAETDITFVYTDSGLDLYRAGLCAGYLAKEKKVLFFDDGLFPEDLKEKMIEDFASFGFSQEPVFNRSHVNYASYEDLGCVVLASPASRFFEQRLDIPIIVFSWVDPDLTPRDIKLVFDDSLWTLAKRALKLPHGSGETKEILLPSAPALLKDRIDRKRDVWKLRSLLRKKL